MNFRLTSEIPRDTDTDMHQMTLRLEDDDAQLLALLSRFYGPDKLRGMPFNDVIRTLIRTDAARNEIAQPTKKRKSKS